MLTYASSTLRWLRSGTQRARTQASLYMSQLQLLAGAEHTALGMAMHAVATVAHHLARRKPASQPASQHRHWRISLSLSFVSQRTRDLKKDQREGKTQKDPKLSGIPAPSVPSRKPIDDPEKPYLILCTYTLVNRARRECCDDLYTFTAKQSEELAGWEETDEGRIPLPWSFMARRFSRDISILDQLCRELLLD